MAEKKPTVFQNLNKIVNGTSVSDVFLKDSSLSLTTPNRVVYSTTNKADYDAKMEELKQQKLLSYQWVKAGADIATDNLAGYTAVKLMFRDADLMETMPEIGAALDIVSEEACNINAKGKMLNISSKSKRIKAVLEDLFYNRLHVNTMLPMVCRGMCKYGNDYELLNIDKNNGIMGWRRLPVYEIDRLENGYGGASGMANVGTQTNVFKQDDVKFVWGGRNDSTPYLNWQVAHFRMLNDSFFLPYGTSILHKARRAWRMLSMMEDAMLIYRLDKSIERRVFKIYVGAIDDADVPAFVQEVANNFKRTPIIDPLTGQVDLRKNFMDVSTDYFIPVRREDAPNPIETLQAAHNTDSMEDIQHMENKIFAALRVPKSYLNFQEPQGRGQNLSLLDIRFCRMVNKIQQYLLLELNKVAMVHLYILGFKDDIANFTLSMNNPSAQIEALELEDISKRVQVALAAAGQTPSGIPLMSLHKVLREIMKMSDNEIKDMLNEIRLEMAMAAELQATAQVIKKTGIFDPVDRIYGDPDVLNKPVTGQPQQQEGGPGAMGGGMQGGGEVGDSLHMDSLGAPGEDTSSSIGGTAAETPVSNAPEADAGTPLQEIIRKGGNINENVKKSFMTRYFDMLAESMKKSGEIEDDATDYVGKNMFLNEELKKSVKILENLSKKYDEIEKGLEMDELSRENEAFEDE
jgi:hypothetical protein